MCHGNMHLGGGQSSTNRRVRIPIDNDDIWKCLAEYGLYTLEDQGSLPPVRAGTNLQMVIGLAQLKLFEEYLRHPVIVMLARVYDDVGNSNVLRRGNIDCLLNRKILNELGPGAQH